MSETRNKIQKTNYLKSQSSNRHQIFNDKLRESNLIVKNPIQTLETRQRQICISRNIQLIYYNLSINQQDIQQETDRLIIKIQQMKQVAHNIKLMSLQKNNKKIFIQKAPIAKQMGLSYDNLCKQSFDNNSIINSLKAEFEYIYQKLDELSNPSIKLNEVLAIQQSTHTVKRIKRQIEKMKKERVFVEKQIVKERINQNTQLQQLQKQYILSSKKQEQLIQRVQIVQQDIINSDINRLKQKQYYNSLKQQMPNHLQSKSKNINQHVQIIYKSHKKQLQFNINRHQRHEQIVKKKYYKLLVDYQNSVNRKQQIDNKIYIVCKQNQQAVCNIQYLLKRYKSKKTKSKKQTIFTQPKHSIRHYKSQKKEQQFFIADKKEGIQRKLNKKNAFGNIIFRKGENKEDGGIIIRQNLSSSLSRQNQSKQLYESNQSSQKYQPSKNNFPSKQIRHFRTQSAPVIDYQCLTNSKIGFIEEAYQDDYDQ